jgi:hypothetical protein
VLAAHGWVADGDGAERDYYTTGDAERFGRALRELVGVEDEVGRAVWAEGRLDIPK